MLGTSGRRAAAIVAGIALAAALPLAPQAVADQHCSAPDHPNGEWGSYGLDLTNSRHQTAPTSIGLGTVANLETAFVVDVGGAINSTPIVDGGCIFVSSQGTTGQAARITALDAASGTLIWTQDVAVGTAAFGGPQVGSPALWDDLVLVPFNKRGGPFVTAFDRHDGAIVWTSAPLDGQPSSGTNASLIVHDGIVFTGFFGAAGPWQAERGGFVLLDAATGAVLKKTHVIPDADFNANDREGSYAGAGIWGTPVVDITTGFAYVGTSNPHNPRREHERSNAILKIDLRRASSTFGEIDAHYKGVHDTIVPGAQDQPVCDTAPDVNYYSSFSATCVAIDLDFGASPNLIRLNDRTLVGAQQKAGIYHVVDATDMSGVTMTPVGVACFSCSAATSAFAGGRAFVPAGPPGQMVAVSVGEQVSPPAWATPIAGGFTYNPASVANGLVWAVDSLGFLNAFTQDHGVPVVKRAMSGDTGESMFTATTSSGIAIAHDRLFVAATHYVIAYRTAAPTATSGVGIAGLLTSG